MAACMAHSFMRRFLQQSFLTKSRPLSISSRLCTSDAAPSPPPAASSASASPSPAGIPDSPGDVQLSDSCVRQLRRLAADGSRLRLAVDGGGCSGFQYVFSLDESAAPPREDDVVVERDGASVLVDAVSLEYIRGSTVDYHEELIRSAFRIVGNPQSEQGCSCGASFSIKID